MRKGKKEKMRGRRESESLKEGKTTETESNR